jgi:hypothetical protein
MALKILSTAGSDQGGLVWEVAIHRDLSDLRVLCDVAHRRGREPLGLVQLDCGLNNLLSGLILPLGSPLELIWAFHDIRDTPHFTKLDKKKFPPYKHIS